MLTLPYDKYNCMLITHDPIYLCCVFWKIIYV